MRTGFRAATRGSEVSGTAWRRRSPASLPEPSRHGCSGRRDAGPSGKRAGVIHLPDRLIAPANLTIVPPSPNSPHRSQDRNDHALRADRSRDRRKRKSAPRAVARTRRQRTKILDHIDEMCRVVDRMRSPFLVMSTYRSRGGVSMPRRRVTPAGFVRVVDAHTRAIPRPAGQPPYDGFTNIIETGANRLVFLVPTANEVVRVERGATGPSGTWCPSAESMAI